MIYIHELLLNFILNNKIKFIFYILFTGLLYPLHHILIPDYYGKIIGSFKDKNGQFISLIKMLLFLYICGQMLDMLVLYTQYYIVPEFSEHITITFFTFLLHNYNYDFDNIKMGEVISKMNRLPEILFNYIDVFRMDILKQLFVFTSAIIHYYNVSSTILQVFIVYLIIHYIFFYLICKKFYFYNKEVNKFQDRTYEYLNDTFQNMSTVYSLNQASYEKSRFYNFSFKAYKTLYGLSHLTYLYGYILWACITISMYVIMNYFLYKSYKTKLINATQLISSFVITWSILSLYEKAIDSAWSISNVYGQIHDSEDYFNDIYKRNLSIKTKTVQNQNKDLFKNGDIVFSNIYHKYADTFVLDNVSVTIKKGEKVAFIGQIGSGKSTLVKLLMGYQPLTMGTITIDGISVNDIDDKVIRKNIFYIPQKTKLFNRTLYDNIIYGLPPEKCPSKEQLKEMLLYLKIEFDLDLDEKVGVEGNGLSGGQKQIVWLIRSFLRPSSILVLDEPTSALDPDNKKLINKIIKQLTVGKTVIIVSHDDIDPMFRTVELRDGKVISNNIF